MAKRNKVQAKIAADVKKFGWHVMKVFSDSGDEPPFAYTIGLETSFDHPEVVIFGLNDDLDFMHRVLNIVGGRVAKGERFEHGAKKRGILQGYVCPFARFPKSAYDDHLGQAIDFHGGSRFRAVQCIWPDPKKRLPWDPRVMLPILSRQPVFLRPDAGARDPKWAFDESPGHLVITSRQVATGKEPIRYVERFDERRYQFVCGTTSKREDMVVATLGWVIDRDPSVVAAAKLAPGNAMRRAHRGGRWTRVRLDEHA